MKHQVVSLQRQRALDLAAKSSDGFRVEVRIPSRQIHQVIRVDRERLEVVLLAQPDHLSYMSCSELVRLPLTRTRREDLQDIAAKPIGALGGVVYSTRG